MYEPYAIKLAKEFKDESRVSMVSVEILNNWEKLCDQIDELIEQHYSELIDQLAVSIYNMAIGTDGKLIFKLEVYNDGCPWDCSGNQRTTDQRLDPNEKLYDFLDSEYIGGWEATFVSHYGKHWRTYGDPISDETLEFGENAISEAIEPYLAGLSDDERWRVTDNVHDALYDESKSNLFFSWESIFQSKEIPYGLSANTTLREFLLRGKRVLGKDALHEPWEFES